MKPLNAIQYSSKTQKQLSSLDKKSCSQLTESNSISINIPIMNCFQPIDLHRQMCYSPKSEWQFAPFLFLRKASDTFDRVNVVFRCCKKSTIFWGENKSFRCFQKYLHSGKMIPTPTLCTAGRRTQKDRAVNCRLG